MHTRIHASPFSKDRALFSDLKVGEPFLCGAKIMIKTELKRLGEYQSINSVCLATGEYWFTSDNQVVNRVLCCGFRMPTESGVAFEKEVNR